MVPVSISIDIVHRMMHSSQHRALAAGYAIQKNKGVVTAEQLAPYLAGRRSFTRVENRVDRAWFRLLALETNT